MILQTHDLKCGKLYRLQTHIHTNKLLELINGFSEVTGYKVNTQKSVTFLYTNNE